MNKVARLICLCVLALVLAPSAAAHAASPLSWSPVTVVDPGPSLAYAGDLTAIACSPARQCVAGDASGDSFVSADPALGARAWRLGPKLRAEAGAISCPARHLCVAVAFNGQLLVSTNAT